MLESKEWVIKRTAPIVGMTLHKSATDNRGLFLFSISNV